MEKIFLKYLFTKGVFVGDKLDENAFASAFALANKFNISISSGREYANADMISLAAEMLGEYVPPPFYRNFPASVRELSPDRALFDQLLHYATTYGMGNFSEAGHAIFEADFERVAFREKTEIKKFVIVQKAQAIELLKGFVGDILLGTRPLSAAVYEMVKAFVVAYGYEIEDCACKDTVIQLLLDLRKPEYAKFLMLSDVIKLVDIMNYKLYENENLKKLNLKNKDRKFIAGVIDAIFNSGACNARECCERKKLWCGLLHHIHYQPKTPEAERFVALMRGKENISVYSAFEKAMLARDIESAVTCLQKGKGSGALLRRLNYILSRCTCEADIAFVCDALKTQNTIVLVQLMMQYANYVSRGARVFKFTRYNKLKVHMETPEEVAERRSTLSEETVTKLYKLMRGKLEDSLRGKLGKVYISKEMYNVAVPLQETTSNFGYGVLPKGSRLPIEQGKKVRAFTYWEKVNDIDLSVIGITEDGEQDEFSWRTMYGRQSKEIAYSGDQTSGYNGGSEYFDVDVALFKKMHPKIKYLVFCNNVFSCVPFDQCLCKAGFMLRDIKDTGKVFEPKSVKSSFVINCSSTFAYLFGIDLENNDFVWLNVAREGNTRVAGATPMAFLIDYFKATSVLNVGTLFEMLATEVVENAEDADVIVSDSVASGKEGCEIIRSFDFEKITALLN